MKRFIFSNCTMLHNKLFMIGCLGGLPAQMSLDDRKVKYFDEMKGFVLKESSVVIDFVDYFQKKVYALDSTGNSITIFDLENCQCQYVALTCNHRSRTNFVAFERLNADYYIFPKYENRIYVYGTKENEIREIIEGYLSDINEIQCACRVKDDVWLLPKDSNIICRYNLFKREKEIFELNMGIKDCVHAIFNGKDIYILNMYGIIYKWDVDNIKLCEIAALEIDYNVKEPLSRIVYAGNKLILLPACSNDIMILDLITKRTEKYHDYPEDFLFQEETFKFYGYCEDEKYYFFAQCFGNYLLMIEKKSGELIWVKPIIDYLGEQAIKLLKNKVIYEKDVEISDLFNIASENQYNNIFGNGKEIYFRMIK